MKIIVINCTGLRRVHRNFGAAEAAVAAATAVLMIDAGAIRAPQLLVVAVLVVVGCVSVLSRETFAFD